MLKHGTQYCTITITIIPLVQAFLFTRRDDLLSPPLAYCSGGSPGHTYTQANLGWGCTGGKEEEKYCCTSEAHCSSSH